MPHLRPRCSRYTTLLPTPMVPMLLGRPPDPPAKSVYLLACCLIPHVNAMGQRLAYPRAAQWAPLLAANILPPSLPFPFRNLLLLLLPM